MAQEEEEEEEEQQVRRQSLYNCNRGLVVAGNRVGAGVEVVEVLLKGVGKPLFWDFLDDGEGRELCLLGERGMQKNSSTDDIAGLVDCDWWIGGVCGGKAND